MSGRPRRRRRLAQPLAVVAAAVLFAAAAVGVATGQCVLSPTCDVAGSLR